MSPNQMKITANETTLAGKYANVMNISHTPDEFILDFISVVPAANTATLTARVITSPGHLKRIVQALNENLSLYERNVQTIKPAEQPDQRIGF